MILASNDDGIQSSGLARLVDSLKELDEVIVVAPDRERSAVSHALTIESPLRADEVMPGWFAVTGTPTDCIQLGLNGLLRGRERPWLVVSGINRGPNLGDDITYSGTVSAAMEAVLLGVPAVAFSQVGRDTFRFDAAGRFAATLVAQLRKTGLPPDTLLNVNVPDLESPAGFAITRQGKRRYGDAIIEKEDPRGRKYYWIGGVELDYVDAPGTDFTAIHDGLVSVTPLHLDLTNYEAMRALAMLRLDWP